MAAVVDAASGGPGPVSPHEIVVLYGIGLSPTQLALFPPTAGSVPTLVEGVSSAPGVWISVMGK